MNGIDGKVIEDVPRMNPMEHVPSFVEKTMLSKWCQCCLELFSITFRHSLATTISSAKNDCFTDL